MSFKLADDVGWVLAPTIVDLLELVGASTHPTA